mmetsp:Transcript_98998/g.156668  ORF Transcript_98998/g.156668 Transcript_98998/m.156668 type:complete len:211 (-) Transcript_98998:1552-2184(-)
MVGSASAVCSSRASSGAASSSGSDMSSTGESTKTSQGEPSAPFSSNKRSLQTPDCSCGEIGGSDSTYVACVTIGADSRRFHAASSIIGCSTSTLAWAAVETLLAALLFWRCFFFLLSFFCFAKSSDFNNSFAFASASASAASSKVSSSDAAFWPLAACVPAEFMTALLGVRPKTRILRPRRWLSLVNVAEASSSGKSKRARMSIVLSVRL